MLLFLLARLASLWIVETLLSPATALAFATTTTSLLLTSAFLALFKAVDFRLLLSFSALIVGGVVILLGPALLVLAVSSPTRLSLLLLLLALSNFRAFFTLHKTSIRAIFRITGLSVIVALVKVVRLLAARPKLRLVSDRAMVVLFLILRCLDRLLRLRLGSGEHRRGLIELDASRCLHLFKALRLLVVCVIALAVVVPTTLALLGRSVVCASAFAEIGSVGV